MPNPIKNPHLDHNDELLHQETADLLEAFQLMCRKCRSGDVQLVDRGFATSTIALVCLGCGNAVYVYAPPDTDWSNDQ